MSKILYVEDHPVQRDILAQMLELNGFEVAVANDGLEGVEKARSWLPDLILMDLRMPRMDGFEAIKAIRSKNETANIPIIAFSAYGYVYVDKVRALVAGADEYFTKPIDLSRLLTIISNCLQDDYIVEKRKMNRQTLSEMNNSKKEGCSNFVLLSLLIFILLLLSCVCSVCYGIVALKPTPTLTPTPTMLFVTPTP